MQKEETTQSVVLERIVAAPIELVWQMWTEAEHFKQWYGPTGATISTAKMDAQVGGSRLICMEMETPNGPMKMWFTGEYTEVVPNERLVYTEGHSDENGNVQKPSDMGLGDNHPEMTEVRVELSQIEGKTKIVMTHIGVPAESPGAQGWSMALDKLEKLLRATSA